jgi:hypothetical protein
MTLTSTGIDGEYLRFSYGSELLSVLYMGTLYALMKQAVIANSNGIHTDRRPRIHPRKLSKPLFCPDVLYMSIF